MTYSPVAKPHAMTITAKDRIMVNLTAASQAVDLAIRHRAINPVLYKIYARSLLVQVMCLSTENYVLTKQ